MKIKTTLCHLFYKNKLIFTQNLLIQMLNLNAMITYKNMKSNPYKISIKICYYPSFF